jgi:hypothetical protein
MERLQAIDLEVMRCLNQRLVGEQVESRALEDRERSAASLRRSLLYVRDFAAAAAARRGEPALRLPTRLREWSARTLAESAHAMLDQAAERRAVLEMFGMPPALLEDARRDLAAMEEAMDRRAQAVATCVAAGRTIRSLAQEAFSILRHLDVLVRTRFADDPVRVAEWDAARTVVWPGRKDGKTERHKDGRTEGLTERV